MARQFFPVALAGLLAAACAQDSPAPTARHVSDISIPIDTQVIEALVPRNATLDGLLREHNLSIELVQAAVVAARDVFDPRDLRANRPYRLVRSLDGLLRALPRCLSPGGRVAILTFHSGEDRRVKKAFQAGFRDGTYAAIARDVIRSTMDETRANRRSSAAKLRWAVRASA